MRTLTPLLLSLGLLACATVRPSQAPAVQPAAAPPTFIEDDYGRALALARERNLPLFADAWAPW
ncbi:MAG: hypothetical protein L0Y66_04305 [Myxococcaceae bacterium]|nr:hypothetical protein [Myxococcaceae bacterium]MCI0670200.1 hypothetical protein [Myxococcaceae bacterium]